MHLPLIHTASQGMTPLVLEPQRLATTQMHHQTVLTPTLTQLPSEGSSNEFSQDPEQPLELTPAFFRNIFKPLKY